jgi:predicted dehydrogenase
MVEVTNPDIATVLCRFRNGAMGTIDFSRVAMGRKFLQTYEIYGTKGSLLYDNDEINRIRFYSDGDPVGAKGFREIDVGAEIESYRAFLPLPNFGLGYNETKLIEVSEVVRSVSHHEPAWPTFADGVRLVELVDATVLSGAERRWVRVGEASPLPLAGGRPEEAARSVAAG